MKIKTIELTGAALDLAVAQCEGAFIDTLSDTYGPWIDGPTFVGDLSGYSPSTNWSQGGPIIERERIDVTWSDNQWIAMWWADNSGMAKNSAQRFVHNRQKAGPTPLIAAMRAYVASKMGEEVDVPDELED